MDIPSCSKAGQDVPNLMRVRCTGCTLSGFPSLPNSGLEWPRCPLEVMTQRTNSVRISLPPEACPKGLLYGCGVKHRKQLYGTVQSHGSRVSLGDLTNLDSFLPTSWTCAPKKFWLVPTRTHSASLHTQNPPLGHYSGCTLTSAFSIPEVFVCHLARGLSGSAPVVWTAKSRDTLPSPGYHKHKEEHGTPKIHHA